MQANCMQGNRQEGEPTRKRKRGPYKQYQYRDSENSVPKSSHYKLLSALDPTRPSRSVSKQPCLKQTKQRHNSSGISKGTEKSDYKSQQDVRQDHQQDVQTDVSLSTQQASCQNTTQNNNEIPHQNVETSAVLCNAESVPNESGAEPVPLHESEESSVVINETEWREVNEEDESENFVQNDTNDEELQFLQPECEVDQDSEPSEESSDSDSDEEVLAEAPELYLTVKEKIKLFLLLATKKRHKLTYAAAECIMDLAGVLSEETMSSFTPRKHLMKEAIQSYSTTLKEHHMCPSCGCYVGVLEERQICPECDTEINPKDNKKKGNIFLYLPLKEQLTALLEGPLSDDIINPEDRTKINPTNLEDIFDGKLYKERIHHQNCLSLNFFVDGLQVTSTSKTAAWPILVTINELPLHKRRKHVLMASVWLSKKKPVMNEYLKPFVVECCQLQTEGIILKRNGVERVMKFVVLVGISDSIARPLLRNSTQFNGRFGCGLCYHPGLRMRRGRGYARSYSIRNGEYGFRTHTEVMELAREAIRLGTPQRGIKGLSILSDIDGFDIVQCLDLDLFHALVNTAKRFTNLWLDSTYKRHPFNVCENLAEVDRRLLAITPTNNVARAPRSLKERSDYRGHEWFYWVVFYSLPVMRKIIPQRYLNHWSLLVRALVLLMQNSVSRSEIVYAGRYLHQFNYDIDDLYGREHVTFSIHLLLHLTRSTINFSQPWSHSAFVYESFNGELKAAVKSSNGVAHQLCKHMQLRIALEKMEEDLLPDMSEREIQYLENVKASTKRLADPHLVIGAISLLGNPHTLTLPLDIYQAFLRAGVHCDQASEYRVFDRCIFNGEVYQSSHYAKVVKQNNSVVLLDSDRVFQTISFIVVSNVCYALGHFLKENRQLRLCDQFLPHIRIFEEAHERTLRCIPVLNFQSKLLSFVVKISENESFRVSCVNVLKLEMLT